jgi:hypothetical protein
MHTSGFQNDYTIIPCSGSTRLRKKKDPRGFSGRSFGILENSYFLMLSLTRATTFSIVSISTAFFAISCISA